MLSLMLQVYALLKLLIQLVTICFLNKKHGSIVMVSSFFSSIDSGKV